MARVIVKPDQVEAFIAAQSKIKQALTEASNRGAIRWYELVSGGQSPQFLMLADRDNWAAYEQSPDEQLADILEKIYGRDRASSIVQEADRAVQSRYVETWQYRADLSFIAAAN